ncbi:MAG: hypothetical protein MJ241_03545 [Bacilli bacterium]|nr:hypothetical protein [Bacilli bacterium]
MKNLTFLFVSTLSIASALVPNKASVAKVAPSVYYIDSVKGNDNNGGTEDSPFKTLDKALSKSGDLEIHLIGNETYKSSKGTSRTNRFGEGHDNISIIGEIGDDEIYPRLAIGDVDGNGYIGTNLILNKINYTNPATQKRHSLFACGNDLTFGDDCKVDNDSFVEADGFDTCIEYARDFQIFAGGNGPGGKGKTNSSGAYVAGPALAVALEGNENTLTFLSGDFGKITLSNRVADTGSMSNHYKPKLVLGGTAYASYVGSANDWFNYIDSEITIKDEARVHRVVGGVAGYQYTSSVGEKTYIYSGSTTINVEGGYVKNLIGGSMGRTSAFVKNEADTFINVSGGYIESFMGGSAAGNTYGDINVNVTGGTFGNISDDVMFGITDLRGTLADTNHESGFYCGGAGASSMIHTDDKNKLSAEVYGNLGCCYRENDILNPSNKVMAMGNVYGSINATITGGTFNCNVYGGGKGFDYSKVAPTGRENDLFNVAQVTKGVNLNLSGCTVNGNVYGGGAGISGDSDDYLRIALVAGTINLNIGNTTKALNDGTKPSDYETVINGTIYGGGVNPKVTSLGAADPVVVLGIHNTYINNPNPDDVPASERIAVHGGSENADVDGNILIDIKGSSICNNIYLGSGSGDINGSIKIDILDSKIEGDLTLGSVTGDINGDVTVLVEGLSVIEDINVGSDSGTINGKVEVTISSTSVSKDINIGTEDDSFKNEIEVTVNKGTSIGGTINDNTGDASLDLNISDDTSITGEMVYVQSFVRARGNYDNARLEAVHKNKPENVVPVYRWYKYVDGKNDELVYEGENNFIEHLTSKDVGSYYCQAVYTPQGKETVIVTSNTARFVEKSDVKAAQVGFDSTPVFNFYVDLSSTYNPNDEATIQIGADTVTVKGTENMSLGYKTYKFSVALAPYQMGSDIRILIDNEAVDAKYSVKQYCKEVLSSNSSSEKLKSLVTALLNYGAAAQEYFDYQKYSLANSYLEEDAKVLSTSIDEKYNKLNIENNSDDIKAYSATVEILTSTTIRVYFVEKPEGSIDGYEASINGEMISSDKILSKNGRYYVEINNVSAKDLDKEFTVRLSKGESYVSVTYSVLTYCYSKQNSSNESLRNFALSLYDYYMAVEDYLAK